MLDIVLRKAGILGCIFLNKFDEFLKKAIAFNTAKQFLNIQ